MPGAWSLESGIFRRSNGIPLTDRGFRYGMSVFETVGVYKGRGLFLKEHVRNLSLACRELGFDVELPPLERPVARLIAKSHGMLRLYVTAGDGAPHSETAPRIYALFEQREFPSPEAVAAGVKVLPWSEAVAPVPGGWKTGNYWANIRASRWAREQKVDEAVLFSVERKVIGAAMGNLFLVKDGRIFTPSREHGARPGVVREWVMEQCVVEESALTETDLASSDECFLTNSRIGVVPVKKFGDRELPDATVGMGLANLYREKILAD